MSSKKLYTVSANNLNILLEFSEWPVRTVCQCQYWSQVKVNAPVQRQYLETPINMLCPTFSFWLKACSLLKQLRNSFALSKVEN